MGAFCTIFRARPFGTGLGAKFGWKPVKNQIKIMVLITYSKRRYGGEGGPPRTNRTPIAVRSDLGACRSITVSADRNSESSGIAKGVAGPWLYLILFFATWGASAPQTPLVEGLPPLRLPGFFSIQITGPSKNIHNQTTTLFTRPARPSTVHGFTTGQPLYSRAGARV